MDPQRSSDTIPVIAHLSGARRGTSERLSGAVVWLVLGDQSTVYATSDEAPSSYDAELSRRGQSYELTAVAGREIWVNGERTERLVLASGDVIEIGKGGPVIRFRLYPLERGTAKSVGEVFSDCWACARHESGGALHRAAVFLAGVPMGLATQTSRSVRLSLLAALMLLVAATVVLAGRTVLLERRLAEEQAQVSAMAALLEKSRDNPASEAELKRMLAEVRDSMTAATERLGALEQRSEAPSRVIAAATRATVLLLGSYGFVDSASGDSLRITLAPGATPIPGPNGDPPPVTPERPGPVFEVRYTGTGFIASSNGLILTNRHVAVPWEFDEAAAGIIAQGFTPVMRRFIAYMPGVEKPFDVQTVRVSDEADLALLRGSAVADSIVALHLSIAPVHPGQEVIVLGYPLGIRALMARTGATFVQQLLSEGDVDFWTAAERLSARGFIAPLASRGIIGQVTPQTVVYDAQTTHGGSGGPVLSTAGEVVAINSAILAGFGGSNIGVPAKQARRLLVLGIAFP
ncbi:MAG: trypsin-like serine protease [Gemmatimonadales bacterium]|nr:trypsin-like serine protease [Gemmatimonadales bacterium]